MENNKESEYKKYPNIGDIWGGTLFEVNTQKKFVAELTGGGATPLCPFLGSRATGTYCQ